MNTGLTPEDRALRGYFARRWEDVAKVGFTCRDGREFLGWIADVDDDRVLVTWAPGPFDDRDADDEWFPLTAIRPGTAAHYDTTTRVWVPYQG
ncbi:hypothetical protein GCM10009639_42070 [Kitasatospora putterlickiae]|uniref:Uncharacterized protein n=1 Tax=Kitasatospora putterlickiae TaxID=221725 RepID=A0ABN1Y8A5_9ACTN